MIKKFLMNFLWMRFNFLCVSEFWNLSIKIPCVQTLRNLWFGNKDINKIFKLTILIKHLYEIHDLFIVAIPWKNHRLLIEVLQLVTLNWYLHFNFIQIYGHFEKIYHRSLWTCHERSVIKGSMVVFYLI